MKLIIYLIILITLSFGKLLHPINNIEIETLLINKNEIDYYILRGNECIYEIEGPKLINLYFRKPVPKKINIPIDVSFNLRLDNTESLEFLETLSISDNTKSKKHPAHSFSKSGKIQINIPKGKHQFRIKSKELPMLVRLTHQLKPKRRKSFISETDYNNNQILNVITGKKSTPYSMLETGGNALFSFSEDFEGDFWLYSRCIYNNESDFYQPYILNFNENNKVVTSIFYSSISTQSKIENIESYPGKLRTSYFSINSKDSEILIFNKSPNRNVLIRGEFIPK
ncbi:MAG: hypothetical protein H8E60_02260 [Candidatus Marinimicrobia bacterium]|nr:hypothetical protein [Candidatus Neomarinimicrobiota bacterium]